MYPSTRCGVTLNHCLIMSGERMFFTARLRVASHAPSTDVVLSAVRLSPNRAVMSSALMPMLLKYSVQPETSFCSCSSGSALPVTNNCFGRGTERRPALFVRIIFKDSPIFDIGFLAAVNNSMSAAEYRSACSLNSLNIFLRSVSCSVVMGVNTAVTSLCCS